MKLQSKHFIAVSIGILLTVQIFLTVGSFRSIDDITNDRPILNIDFCSQYYWSHAARAFSEQSGRLWGYDPFYMAGYPLSFVFNSSLPVQLVSVALSDLSLARIIKACFIVTFILVPLVLYYSLSQFELPPGAALAAASLGTVLFWISENALFGRFGMISGAFLLNFFMVPLGLLARFLRGRDNRALTLLFFAMPLAFTIHKTAFVLVLPISLMWIVALSPSLKSRDWGILIALFVFTGLANLHWLYPFFKFLPLKIEDPGTTFFQAPDPAQWLKDLKLLFALPLARVTLIITGIVGLVKLKRDKSPAFLPLLAAAVFLGALAYFGFLFTPLRHLQPYRYVSAFYYIMLPASGFGLAAIYKSISTLKGGKAISPALFASILVALLMLPSFRYFSRVAPLRTGLDRESTEFMEWAKSNTDRSARILMEDINVWKDKPIYGGARLVGILPALLPREMIGGPLPNAFIKHHYAGFHDGVLLGRPVSSYSQEKLAEIIKLYNIGWIVCWSDESKKRFSDFPGADKIKEFGYLAVFATKSKKSFLLEGSGRVDANYNRIQLSGLSTRSGRVVVSYHWVDGLKASPYAELKQVMKGDDPIGFIGIENPPPKLTIGLGQKLT